MVSFKYRASRAEGGQGLAILVVSMVGLLAITALAVDLGFMYHAYSELQASANASATAGAGALPNSDWATVATNYSGVAGDKNVNGDLSGVTMVAGYPQGKCLQYMVNNFGLSCNNAVGYNAVAVVETVTVPTFFAKVIGINSMTLTAYALAAMKGGEPSPANVMLILDSTASMKDADTDPNCIAATGIADPSKLDCAKWGARILMSSLDPCATTLTSCGSATEGSNGGYNVPNPVQTVGLLTFPGLATSGAASYDYTNCGSSMGSQYINSYGPPTTSPPYFTIVQPSSNYRTSDSAGLNGASSNLVQAVDWQDGVPGGCIPTGAGTAGGYGIEGIGGKGTYYAGITTEAASDLAALPAPQNAYQNVIIVLSDGAANAKCVAGTGSNSNYCAGSGSQFTSTTPTSYGSGECAYAVTAAQHASETKNAAGLYTWVFTVGFGSETATSQCSTDTDPTIAPCTALQEMASVGGVTDLTKFYSDDSAGCVAPDHPDITGLSSIFGQAIPYELQTTRLLPFNTD